MQLIYYLPDHSKYNPIERCWAALEQFWYGALAAVETALQWASNLRVEHVQQVYEKGGTVDAKTLATYRVDWHPSEDLPQWVMTIGTQ